MDPKDVTRYVRPEDIPLLDGSILDPIVKNTAKEMASAYPENTVEQWEADLSRALLAGEVLIVIDDRNKRIGLVRSDRPPFLGLGGPSAPKGGPSPADPLNLKRWESEGV